MMARDGFLLSRYKHPNVRDLVTSEAAADSRAIRSSDLNIGRNVLQTHSCYKLNNNLDWC